MLRRFCQFLFASLMAALPAMAEDGRANSTISDTAIGLPEKWQLNFQDAATPVKQNLHEFHTLLLWITGGIVGFVTLLLLYTIWRFSAKRNPEPSKRTHNVAIEILWTVIPVLILMVIAWKSFPLMYYMDRTTDPELTVKVVGYQWYWGYEYPDHDLDFIAYMIPDEEIEEGQQRLLETDKRLILPTDRNIKFIITSADVIHSWAMPSFGIKTDAIPGRLNETWARIDEPGVYYGQCSEICGVGHAFMPIAVQAVPPKVFDLWIHQSDGDYIELAKVDLTAELPDKSEGDDETNENAEEAS
jgi:cytochrome c oxidase subunit 2